MKINYIVENNHFSSIYLKYLIVHNINKEKLMSFNMILKQIS